MFFVSVFPSKISLTNNLIPITNTGNIELTCSTDETSANKHLNLEWFRRTDDNAEKTIRIYGGYDDEIAGNMSTGYNFTEKLMLKVDESMNGDKIYCCAVYADNFKMCVSRLISLSTSGKLFSGIYVIMRICPVSSVRLSNIIISL
jgi:hypothetical protein